MTTSDRSPDEPIVIDDRRGLAAGRAVVHTVAGPVSFETFYRDEYQPMVRLAALIVGSTEAAEEIVQDAFVRLHQRWDRVDSHGAYLRTCVVNGCTDRVRRRMRLRQRVAMIAHEAETLADAVKPVDGSRTDLVVALGKLSLRSRSALVLRFYGGFSEVEIARALGVRPGSVKSLIHRGLERLRQEMEP